MKVALVHDYLNEFGGAERVLLALTEIWPEAVIYTAFCKAESEADKRFKDKTIITSWVQKVPFFSSKLYSPLRFLAPWIWGSFTDELRDYDLVISSSSWYVTKGFKEICYCHTPPRWLYGYQTSKDWQKYWPVRVYGLIVGHFMRHYDYTQAQKVKYFIANSEEVKRRIKKFYRREAVVIYPPVEIKTKNEKRKTKKGDYYLIVSRLVGGKGIEMGIKAAKKMGLKLKIVGSGPLQIKTSKNVEIMGQVSDKELGKLYSGAKAFLALAQDEDFGITPVEAMSYGCPVIAFNGGGYKETVVDGKTGVLFKDYSIEGLWAGIKKFDNLDYRTMQKNCIRRAKKFSKERFMRDIREFVARHSPGK
ncbi:MAG: glycosyltransferase [Patescibacteria group bacterium]|nr:glycosyltransferase [Patescibacteria group bacterium]